ncbi:MAG TPA: universal stress protein [Acidimicrobiales bacterium]|nr:universal stress protein [Acidimicrobiales bacterium]
MTLLERIAVGFDGSADAQVAARWAFRLAGQVGVDVVVVHAVGLLEHVAGTGNAVELEAMAHRLASEEGLDPGRVRWHLADGDPCSVLARAAQPPIEADLVVVGSRGHGARAGLLLGSTSHELAEHSHVPLVIVPAGRTAPQHEQDQ